MSNQPNTNYQTISFNGLALHPTFSVYLFEIEKEKQKYFYVGMTGDSHYPSARSILHRLAGHIDLSSRSTQSQFIKALKEKVFDKEELNREDLTQLTIQLHYWPVEGFTPFSEDAFKNLDKTSADYKAIQTKVLALESKIIGEYHDRLLNKTKGDSNAEIEVGFQGIYDEIKKITEA
ncbi:MAG: hypothetical protein RL264_2396 [Bacteroidota bacterium]|jgi:hypothetical protein